VNINIAETVYGFIDAALKATLSVGMLNVMLALGGLIGTMWIISFTMRSITWLWMGMTGVYKDAVFEIVKVAAIAGLAFNVGWYINTIVPFVTQAPAWMGGVLSNQEGSQVNQIDSMVNTYIASLFDLVSAMNFSFWDADVKSLVLGAIGIFFYILGGIPFILAAILTLVITSLATTLLLVLGPLFIVFALFNSTRQWFWGWVSNLAGFMLTQVMFSVILSLELSFVYKFVIQNGKIDSSLTGSLAMMIYFLVFTVLVTELPSYAASIMGGSPIGGSGILAKGTGFGAAMRIAGLARKSLPKGNHIK
jgi:type IV secretion system protein VirB6